MKQFEEHFHQPETFVRMGAQHYERFPCPDGHGERKKMHLSKLIRVPHKK